MQHAPKPPAPTPSRVRWAAIGAAIAVSIGGGGLLTARASLDSGDRTVFVPITPCRLLDTRPGSDNVGPRATPIGANEVYTATVRGTNGNCTIPSDAVGVAMNVVAVNATASSYLTVFPADVSRPLASNLNWVARQAPTPNAVTADLSADGRISFYNLTGQVDIAADIVGYYVDHTHDDRYYTKSQTDTLLAQQSALAGRMTSTDLASLAWYDDPSRALTVTVGNGPRAVAFDGSSIWVANSLANTVQKIARDSGAVLATVPVGSGPVGLAFGGGSMWVANSTGGSVTRIDPATATVTATIPVSGAPQRLAWDGSRMWVTRAAAGSVSAITPASNTVTATVGVGNSPSGIAFDGNVLWVANSGDNTVSTVSPVNESQDDVVVVGGQPTGVTFDGRWVWVANTGPNTVQRIDPLTVTADTAVSVGSDPLFMAYDGQYLWVATMSGGAIERVVPGANSAVSGGLGGMLIGSAWDVTFDGSALWVVDQTTNRLHRIPTF
ncbi:MAG: YncE family protein [Acidimicrobiales bacterium]